MRNSPRVFFIFLLQRWKLHIMRNLGSCQWEGTRRICYRIWPCARFFQEEFNLAGHCFDWVLSGRKVISLVILKRGGMKRLKLWLLKKQLSHILARIERRFVFFCFFVFFSFVVWSMLIFFLCSDNLTMWSCCVLNPPLHSVALFDDVSWNCFCLTGHHMI